ncbi:MAG: DNA phosphorothioation-associated putative methyltransferase, partial [Polyangiaceae bacterium]
HDAAKRTADIVNLGFVLNVIEDPRERRRALIDAFKHAKRVLVATVMIAGRATIEQFTEYGDGVITKRNTFQKYFTQSEFRDYLTENLGTPPIAVAPGVFYVFRDELDEQLFLLERQRMRRRRPSFFIPEDTGDDAKAHKRAVLESNKELLAEYWDRCLALGRQPKPDEFERSLAVRKLFGSYKQAFSLLLSHFGEEELERARQARADDLLVYFALRQFERRKAYALVPDAIKRDVKEYFGTYRAARAQATELLFSCGKPAVIGDACRQAQHELRIGHLDEDHSLYVLSSQINELPAVLRVYVGCATQLYGDVEAADLVKLHIHSGKVTLLLYDDFDGKAVPLLRERIKIRLRSQAIDFFDYTGEFEPQPLYLKSRFLPDDHPRSGDQRSFDERLAATKLFDLSGFGPGRDEFESTLVANNLRVRGFQLVPRSR